MSRAFVKESDQEEAPVIPPRAALPAGVTNYVTPTGLRLLAEEEAELKKQAAELSHAEDDEQRRALTVINGKLALLAPRLASAQVLEPGNQQEDRVRFGANVTVKNRANRKSQSFQIVGVDEADVKLGKIAFVSPMARAVTGLTVGEMAHLKLGDEVRELEVMAIAYV